MDPNPILALIVVYMVAVILILVCVSAAAGTSSLPYATGVQQQRGRTQYANRALANISTGQQVQTPTDGTPVCDPDQPLVFFPELAGASLPPVSINYFQTALKMHTDRVYDFSATFTFSQPGCMLGIYVDQLEFVHTPVVDKDVTLGPFEIQVKPGDMITLSMRNTDAKQAVVIEAVRFDLVRK